MPNLQEKLCWSRILLDWHFQVLTIPSVQVTLSGCQCFLVNMSTFALSLKILSVTFRNPWWSVGSAHGQAWCSSRGGGHGKPSAHLVRCSQCHSGTLSSHHSKGGIPTIQNGNFCMRLSHAIAVLTPKMLSMTAELLANPYSQPSLSAALHLWTLLSTHWKCWGKEHCVCGQTFLSSFPKQ